jgi:hypothetical protein
MGCSEQDAENTPPRRHGLTAETVVPFTWDAEQVRELLPHGGARLFGAHNNHLPKLLRNTARLNGSGCRLGHCQI